MPESAEEPVEAAELLNQHGRLFAAAPPREAGRSRARTLPLRAALRTLLRQRRRLFLSIIAITLGIGYLAGSLSLLHRVDTGLAQQAGSGTEVADLVIEGEIAVTSVFEEVRRLVPDSLTSSVVEVPGVAAVEPRLESGALLINDGEVLVGLGLTERPMGVNWPTAESLNPYTLVDGRPPTGPDDVVIDSASAAVGGLAVGDKIVVAGTTRVDQFTIVGLLEPLPSSTEDGESLAAFETETAREILSIATDDNFIAIDVADDADIDEVQAAVSTLLPPGTEVVDRATFLEHRQSSLSKSFSLVRYLLLGFTALAIIVGAFTVANSMALLYDHRRRGFALLRLLGGSPRVLISAASVEAVLAGLIAAFIGVVAGLGIGQLIEMAVRSLGSPILLGGGRLTWWIPVIAAVVGVTVTVATAIRPAKRAAATPPLHAVVHVERDTAPKGAGRWVFRALAVGIAAALGWFAASSIINGPSPVLAAAALGAIAAVTLAIPPVLGALVTTVTGLMFRSSKALRRIATSESSGSRSRTSATTAALVLAATVVTGLSSLSTSFISSINSQIETAVLADLVVDSGTVGPSGLTDEVVPRLRELDGVEAVSGWRVGSVRLGDATSRAAGLDGSSALDLFDLDMADDSLTSFDAEEVLVHSSLSTDLDLSVGDEVTLQFQSGTALPVTVAGIFDSNLSTLLGNVILHSDLMASQETNGRDVMAFVRLTDPDDITSNAEVERVGLSSGADSVVPASELFDGRAQLLEGFSRVILWMLLFSVALALVGVVNTLQLGINERRRELALLRAVGATPRQIVRLTLVEAAAMAVVGTVVGVGLGLLITRGTIAALSGVGLTVFSVPVITIGLIAVATVALALISAAVPSYRAAHTPLLAAIAEDDTTTTTARFRKGSKDIAAATAAAPTPPTAHDASPTAPTPPPIIEADVAPPPPPPGTAPTPQPAATPPVAQPEQPAATPPVAQPEQPAAAPTVPAAQGIADSDATQDFAEGEVPTSMPKHEVAEPNSMVADEPAAASTQSDTPRDESQTDAATADRKDDVADDESATESEHESEPEENSVSMPTTCYNCGNDPMDAESCVHCGAVQLPAPVGMFSTTPDAPSARPTAEQYGTARDEAPSPPSGSDGVDDIIDATIIPDDASEFETQFTPPTPPPSAQTPPAPPQPTPQAASPTPPPEREREQHSIGSIFDDPVGSAARSPFGQYANNPDADMASGGPEPAETSDDAWGTTIPSSGQSHQQPPTAPPTAPPTSNGGFGAGAGYGGYNEPPHGAGNDFGRPSAPPSGWQQNPQSGPYPPTSGAGYGEPSPYATPQQPHDGSASRVVGDGHGFAAAIAYLNSPSSRAAQTAFAIAGALLSHEETVRGVVAGVIGGAPAAVVETAHRVIIVADQRYVPIVHTLQLGPGLEVHGRHVGSQASLTFTSGSQTIQVDAIDDVNIAVGLASSVRSATVATEF